METSVGRPILAADRQIRGDETLQDCPRDGGRPGARTSNGAVTGKAHHWLVDFTLVK